MCGRERDAAIHGVRLSHLLSFSRKMLTYGFRANMIKYADAFLCDRPLLIFSQLSRTDCVSEHHGLVT